jgi:hypothetical protein
MYTIKLPCVRHLLIYLNHKLFFNIYKDVQFSFTFKEKNLRCMLGSPCYPHCARRPERIIAAVASGKNRLGCRGLVENWAEA